MRRTLTLLAAASLAFPLACSPDTTGTPDGGQVTTDTADTAPADTAEDSGADTTQPTDTSPDTQADSNVDGGTDTADAAEDTGPQDTEPACECSTVTQCCDGCHPKREGEPCQQPADRVCENGQCVEDCECSDASLRCCDGCHFLPDTHQCGETWEEKCVHQDSKGCGGDVARTYWAIFCSGQRADCKGGKRVRDRTEIDRSCKAEKACVGPGPNSRGVSCVHEDRCK